MSVSYERLLWGRRPRFPSLLQSDYLAEAITDQAAWTTRQRTRAERSDQLNKNHIRDSDRYLIDVSALVSFAVPRSARRTPQARNNRK